MPDGYDITCVNIGRATVRVNAFPDQRSGRVLSRVRLVIPPRHFGIPTAVSPREIDGSNDSAVGYRESEVETEEERQLDRVLKILPAVVGYIGYPGYRYIRDTEVPKSRKPEEKESKLRFAASKRPIAFAKSSRKYFDYLRRVVIQTAERVYPYSGSTASFGDLSLTSGWRTFPKSSMRNEDAGIDVR